MERGFRVKNFMSELNKSFHDRTPLIMCSHKHKQGNSEKDEIVRIHLQRQLFQFLNHYQYENPLITKMSCVI